ncbi:uncharacterized protein BX663DRAFT_527174 [Cokeromyces recurvatus]|uniref:uncharacterized protein n=1 Tax=Cokeromyces recurvatus TaxID=90255 RepID=UPI0022206567|nr:uncharacterized protein BX663DRAFT_527174 [Cokeromyces recurvatus]KAI7897779.1 hypothetical protein BX663DRAFT_527174 [Cokeromyces recurvatus]
MSKDSVKAGNITEPIDKRIYIGGLHPQTTEEQIKERFNKFGSVSHVNIAKNVENECRGFAHMTIHTTPKQWESCLSVYNGAKWRGYILKLEEASLDWQERKRLRDIQWSEKEAKRLKRLSRWNDKSEAFHAKDIDTPVTDNNLRKGWKRGRYGRAIAVMRLRKPNGTRFVFDPSHYKNNLSKLYNLGVQMKPIHRLISSVDNNNEEGDWFDQKQENSDDESKIIMTEDEPKIIMTDDEKRKAAMEKMFNEQKAKKELISQALAGDLQSRNHTKFDNDDDRINTEDAFNIVHDEKEDNQPKDAIKWMFDSDDESDDEYDIKVNPVLEGEEGRKRLELQSTFKGDDRFKLSEDFIDDDKNKKVKQVQEDEIAQELGAEKSQALDVLRSMFGNEKVDNTKSKAESTWTSAARFDPDAEDAFKYLTHHEEENRETSEEEDTNSDDDFFDQHERKPDVTAMPEVSTEKHFEVNTNLKPLFGGAEDEPFTLFGGNDDDDASLFSKKDDKHEEQFISSTFASKEATKGRLGLGVLFFFHLDDPSLMKK